MRKIKPLPDRLRNSKTVLRKTALSFTHAATNSIFMMQPPCQSFGEVIAPTQPNNTIKEYSLIHQKELTERTYVITARNLHENGTNIRAINLLEEGIENFGESSFIWGLLGKCYSFDNSHDEAISAFDKALEYAPNNQNLLKRYQSAQVKSRRTADKGNTTGSHPMYD